MDTVMQQQTAADDVRVDGGEAQQSIHVIKRAMPAQIHHEHVADCGMLH